jgi:3-hydroxyisobutyrate dehydrogenase
MPVAAAAAELVRGMHGSGYDNVDFAALLEIEARNSGLDLRSEDVDVGDGLEPAGSDGTPISARV